MRYVSIVLATAVLIVSSPSLLAQDAGSVMDSTIEAQQDTAWAKMRQLMEEGKSEKADSLQRAYADRFYEYYREHPDTDTGRDVLASAFTMWGNIGSADRVDEALPHIDRSSNVWSSITSSIGNAYARAERPREDYIELLKELNEDLTDPKSRSVVLRGLGEHAQKQSNFEQAKRHFEEMLRLEADSFHIEYAKGALHEINNLRIGSPAPDFTAETLEGNTIQLSDHEGEVVILEFWATWCGPCIPDVPHLKKLYDKYEDENVQLIGISLDHELNKLEEFIENREMDWPQIWQEEGWDGPVADLYNVTGIPDSYVIDQEGTIVAKDVDAKKLDETVGDLLSENRE